MPVRIAVIGAGAFGRNHLRVLHELEAHAVDTSSPSWPVLQPVQLAAVVDANPLTRAEAASRYSLPAFATVEDLLAANLDLQGCHRCRPHHGSRRDRHTAP